MSLSRRNKRKKPEIMISNFYAKQLLADPWLVWEGGLVRMDVYASRKVTRQKQ